MPRNEPSFEEPPRGLAVALGRVPLSGCRWHLRLSLLWSVTVLVLVHLGRRWRLPLVSAVSRGHLGVCRGEGASRGSRGGKEGLGDRGEQRDKRWQRQAE